MVLKYCRNCSWYAEHGTIKYPAPNGKLWLVTETCLACGYKENSIEPIRQS